MFMINTLLLLSSTVLPALCHPAVPEHVETAVTERSQPPKNPLFDPTNAPILQLSSDPYFSFYLEEVLALANNAGSNTGEVLRIATQLIPGNFESTYKAFIDMAVPIHAIADSINVTKDAVGARDAYFRAASYYRGADFFLIGNWSDPRNYDLWDKQLECFNKALALLQPVPGERFTVPAYSPTIGNFSVIGVFYKPADDDVQRPTLVVCSGYDGSQEELYHNIVRNGLARGLNVVTYEGPGQPTVRRTQKIGFIPDWWNVVTPIIDYLATRSDVDMSKIANWGQSFGGSLAPIAASQEHRPSALIAIEGLASIQQAIALVLPPKLLELYQAGKKAEFDEILLAVAANTSEPSEARWYVDQGLWAFNTHSPYDWWTMVGAVAWNETTAQNITVPTFLGKGQDDTASGKQPNLAYKYLTEGRPNGKELTFFYEFLTALGAGEHCQLGAESQLNQVVLDWLSDVWGGLAYDNGVLGVSA